ncbi:MAG TPA: hypothetical protein VF062_04635 [Candidatus Limnocylindrales bacterium]
MLALGPRLLPVPTADGRGDAGDAGDAGLGFWLDGRTLGFGECSPNPSTKPTPNGASGPYGCTTVAVESALAKA